MATNECLQLPLIAQLIVGVKTTFGDFSKVTILLIKARLYLRFSISTGVSKAQL
jgi:hypothetical protein